MQSRLVCDGCRSNLIYSSGATNVVCMICSMVNFVPPTGAGMRILMCGNCPTLIVRPRRAMSLRCPSCQMVSQVPEVEPRNNCSHINCGNCETLLMYHVGATSVLCALCQFITNVNVIGYPYNETVVVRNPETFDEHGNLVSNVVAGVMM